MSSDTNAPGKASIPRTVWVLGFVSMFMDVSSEIVASLLPLYLVTGLGASAAIVGFIEGLSFAIATSIKPFAGFITDRTGRRKPLVIAGYGLGAVSKLVFPLAASLGWIIFAKAIDRIGKGIRSAPRDALIADVAPPHLRGASFGLRKSLDTVGGFVGPLLAIALMLVLSGNIQAVLWVAVIPAFIAVVVLIVGAREPAAHREAGAPRPPLRIAEIVRLNRATWISILVASLLTATRISEAFLLLGSQNAGLSLAWGPMTLVVLHATYALSAYPVGRLSDRMGRNGLLAASLVFLAVAYAVMSVAASVPVFLCAIALWGLHMGFSQGLLATLIADAAPASARGTAFGVFNLMTGLVVIAVNVAAGLAWDIYGAPATFRFGAGLAVTGFIAFALLMARSKGKAASRP